ncbi:uncharacterized protein LOC120193376 [Hibiscus syriacus]|uniref:uncharacterized protein LOC120193376 n=1 Tax=Hibiscus syriacus TaxID=106335 RepID=UPI001920925F|nr:uncharacterized protein LOC120193376 [Hibiscus syriacus]
MMNQQAISFQSAALTSSSEMIPMRGYFAPAMNFTRNSGILTAFPDLIEVGNSSGSSPPLDSVTGLKQDTMVTVEWSVDELYILKDGLERYKKEPNILKYIKIAAMLPGKTARDVALRCRWLQRKQRKPEELNVGEKVNNRKDTLVESSSKMNIPSSVPQSVSAYSIMTNHLDQNERMPSEGIFGTTMHHLKQNSHVFGQITFNLSAYKDNINLFFSAKNNITAMLNDMRDMPGFMSLIPTLLVSINEDLANSMLRSATQRTLFGSPSGINLKQELRC